MELLGGGGNGKDSSSFDIQLMLLSNAELSSSSKRDLVSSSPTLEDSILMSPSPGFWIYIDSLSITLFFRLFLTAFRRSVPPAPKLMLS